MTDWEAVVSQHLAIVRRTVYRLVGNHADAWDCIQETFLEAVKIERRDVVRNWPALLRRLATARALDLLRLRSRQRSRGSPGRTRRKRPAGSPIRPVTRRRATLPTVYAPPWANCPAGRRRSSA